MLYATMGWVIWKYWGVFRLVVDTRESSGAKVAFNQFSFFVRGAGGFGGNRTSDKLVPAAGRVPDGPPSFTATQKTSVDQVWFHTTYFLMFEDLIQCIQEGIV